VITLVCSIGSRSEHRCWTSRGANATIAVARRSRGLTLQAPAQDKTLGERTCLDNPDEGAITAVDRTEDPNAVFRSGYPSKGNLRGTTPMPRVRALLECALQLFFRPRALREDWAIPPIDDSIYNPPPSARYQSTFALTDHRSCHPSSRSFRTSSVVKALTNPLGLALRGEIARSCGRM